MTREECIAKAEALIAQANAALRLGNEGVGWRCYRMAYLLRKMATGDLHVKTAYDAACAEFKAFIAAGNAETVDPIEALREIRT